MGGTSQLQISEWLLFMEIKMREVFLVKESPWQERLLSLSKTEERLF